MKKIIVALIFIVYLLLNLYKDSNAQVPILYYDFESNSDRTSFENAVESSINGGSDALTKAGGNGSALHIRNIDGAGLFNGGSATGRAITTQQGGWSSSSTDPGANAEYYYQFTVNTSGFGEIYVSFDNICDSDGPARTGVLYSVNGVNFFTASTSPALTGNESYSNSGNFLLPAGTENRSTLTIRIYAYQGSAADRIGRGSFHSHGKFSVDNVTVSSGSLLASKTLLNEASLYTCITSGSTGSVVSRNSWTISSGATATLSSNVSLNGGQTLTVLSGGTISLGANNILETGASTFNLSSGGRIFIGSNDGIAVSGASGNVQSTTRNFSTIASYYYNGSAGQFTGNGLPAAVENLIINNSYGVTLSADVKVSNALFLTSGIFAIGPNTLTICSAIQGTRSNLSSTTLSGLTVAEAGNGIVIPSSVTQLKNLTISNNKAAGVLFEGSINIHNGIAEITGFAKLSFNTLTATGNSTLKGSSTGKISFRGDLATQISGFTTNTFSNIDGGQYMFAGSSVQTIPGGTYGNLQILNSAGANLGGDVIINGILTLNDPLDINSSTLSIQNPIAGTPTNLRSSAYSSIVVSGFTPGITIPSSITALNNLTISNSQIVTLAGNLTVNDTLTLESTSAFLNVGNNTLTIGTSTSNTGELVRNGGSIRGRVTRWFASGTSTDKLFPLDNGSGSFSQAKITFNSLTTGGTLTASFRNSGSGSLPFQGDGNYIPAPQLGVNLVNISPQYWTITAGDGLTGANYDLEIIADAVPGIINLNYITIIKRNDAANPWTWNFANHNTATGTNYNPVLHYRGGTSFSDFAIGGNIDNLLPVELESFASSVNGNNVTLNWSTSIEENNSGFDIERKTADGDWAKIGNAAGHGTVNTSQSYSYSDRNLASGEYNYRLKQIDFNGNYKYYNLSNEVIIGAPKKFALNQNYPNPFNPSTSISYQLAVTGFVSLKIFDMAGKEAADLVYQNQEAGFYTVKFDASKLSSGIYFYKLQAGDFISTKKMMLVK